MRKMLKKGLACTMALIVSVSGIVISKNETTDVNAAVGDWELVWNDEFNGTSLDTGTWTYEIGNGNWGWGNGEAEYYTNRTDNVQVSDGYLKIIAKKENYGGQKFTSGRIITKGKKSFKYGKMEARIRVENGNQSGVWPAFWMMGEKGGWPDCGELDIMEHANDRNNVGGCIHWNPNGFGGAYDHSYQGGDYYFTDNVNNGITAWHTYGVIWDEKHIEWTVDGVTYHTERFNSSNDYCFQQYQYFILNLAIGGTGTAYTGYQTAPDNYQTATMYVDWVRVSQKEEAPTTAYDGPYITVTEDAVATAKGNWTSYFSNTGWTQAKGTLTLNGTLSDGFTMNATSVGNAIDKDSIWGIQGQLLNLNYYPGNTYKYKCTITSDKDKKVYVKVADDAENVMAGEIIELKAGVPYYYETDVDIAEDFDGTVSLKFGMGIENSGDYVSNGEAVNIKVEDVSFVTTATIPDPDYVNSQTPTNAPTEATTNASTQKVTTKSQTTSAAKVTKPGRTKITKAKRSKNNKKVSLKLKKIKGTTKYQIKYSTSKKFTKKKTKTITTKKTSKIIKRLKANKKYYIKARAIKVVKGKRYVGKWSKRKVVKI